MIERQMGSVGRIAALTAVWCLAGCAELNSIHRVDAFYGGPQGRAIFIDAKQRAILNTKVWDADAQRYMQRYCSEPPPDAFSAFSTALSGDIAGSGLDGASPEAKARAVIAMSETAGTIERTQTVNLLRESLFHTCERFMSGAISPDELIVQSARDQRAMVAVLAIEQLTGAVKAKSTVLSAGSAAAAYTDPSQLYEALKNAQDDEAKAEFDLTKAQTSLNSIKLGAEGCDVIKTKTIPSAEVDASAEVRAEVERKRTELKEKQQQCDSASADVESAKTRVANAKKRTSTFVALADKASVFGFSASSGVNSEFDGGGYDGPPQAVVERVAAAIQAIVEDTNAFNEVMMTCVVRLRSHGRVNKSLLGDDLDRRCLTLIANEADAQAAEAHARTQAAKALATSVASDSDLLSFYLRSGPASIEAKWDAALDYLGTKARLAANAVAGARKARTLGDILSTFGKFPTDHRKIIADAIRGKELQ